MKVGAPLLLRLEVPMLFLSRMRLLVKSVLILGAVLLCSAPSEGQDKVNKKEVRIKTFDGVDLAGTFYPNAGGKREGTVIMIPDFDLKKGATNTKGWSDLAVALQADGYVVLTFDFRGFGESTEVDAGT